MPDGDHIPAHFHITEVGHIAKRFIDCGGKLHDKIDTCLLQTYVADDVDHRLNAGTLAKILQLGEPVLPHDDLKVEVEYEDCAITQSPITSAEFTGEHIELRLGENTPTVSQKPDAVSTAPAAVVGSSGARNTGKLLLTLSIELIQIYQCLCDPTRLRILHLLTQTPLCVCHFQEIFNEPQVKISKHLGVSTRKRNGRG